MPTILQPDQTSDHGVILTIGFVVNGERAATVLPVFVDTSAYIRRDLCQAAVDSATDQLVPSFAAQMSEQAYVSFCSAEGMLDGYIPARNDFLPIQYPGEITGECLPAQTAALLIWYAEPVDLPAGGRMRSAKTFLPGVPVSKISNGMLDLTYRGGLATMAGLLQEGWEDATDPSYKWYRALAAPQNRTTAEHVKRVSTATCRDYVSTQRRRLIPH